MLPLPTRNEAFWKENFEVTESDFEFLSNLFLEEETPIRTPELIQRLIAFRDETEIKKLRKQWTQGEIFRPSETYDVGQKLVFSAFDFASGTVIDSRPGNNPEHGEFVVLKIELETGRVCEVASALKTGHKLNQAGTVSLEDINPIDAAAIYQHHKRLLTRIVVDALRGYKDMVFIAGRWFLKSLLLEVDMGNLHLAEAILDMQGGGPMNSLDIAAEIGFGQDSNPILRAISLDHGLFQDNRFDEVGPAGKVLWYLHRMEPEEIKEPPGLLQYKSVPHDPDTLTGEMQQLETQIDDELTGYDLLDDADEPGDSVSVTLIYPHWRSGTLPLTQRLEYLFPTAYRAPRIQVTLVDVQDGEEVEGWVVRDYGYVYGLADFYSRHKLPVGSYIHVSYDEENPERLLLDFTAYRKLRTEWLWLAQPENGRLRFMQHQTAIGATYDDLIAFAVENQSGVDTLAEQYRRKNVNLATLMRDILSELATVLPQSQVHCKTLYSAVNILRRCPPGPIFATLQSHPSFVNVVGPYWRVAQPQSDIH